MTSLYHQSDSVSAMRRKRISVDPQRPFDHCRTEALLMLQLNHGDDQHLIDSDRVIGERSGRTHGLTDDHQQLNRHPGLFTERLKGGFG